jgi:predicted nucleic acid-binding Zn ribbon protein
MKRRDINVQYQRYRSKLFADIERDQQRAVELGGADNREENREENRVAEAPTPLERSREQREEYKARRWPRRRRPGEVTDLTKIKGIISGVLNSPEARFKAQRYAFILHWREIVGERLAKVSRPEVIENRRLIVQVAHPAWAQELSLIKPVLLESLAKYLRPGDVVGDMVFRVAGR